MTKTVVSVLIFIILISSESLSFDKKIWDNWYFGRRAGITFNTPDRIPVPINDSQINTLEGCASISDTTGKLLFYTNGVSVYNRNGDTMPNGMELKGHFSSTQSALIVKKPKSGSLYYIFTADKGPYEGDSHHDLCFSVVDMSLDSGKGDVTIKNMILHNPVIEKLTAVQHANGEDFWILSRGMNDNRFIIVLLTSGGIKSINTFEIGHIYYPYPASPEFSLGQLKSNPKGDMLATVVYGGNNVELYKFDNQNGLVTEYLGIPVDEEVTALYGAEFSSNNKFLYVNNLFGRIYQYDVSKFDSTSIFRSMKLVYDSLDFNYQQFGQFQLAPNGKIYMGLSYDTVLAAIHKPNVPSPFCRFEKKSLGLNGNLSLFGLPNNVTTGNYSSFDIYGRSICLGFGDSLELFSIAYPEDDKYIYDWTGPDGFRSSEANPKILKPGEKASGLYVCRVSLAGKYFGADSAIINVYDIPIAEITGPPTICPPEIIKLSSKYKSPEYIYKWSTGSNQSEIIINSPGKYHLVVTNPAGCKDSAAFEIKSDDDLSIVFKETGPICSGTPLKISLDTDIYRPRSDYKFLWSTGDSTISTIVTKEGYYSVTVVRSGGCSGTDSVYVNSIQPPDVQLNALDSLILCKGKSVILEPVTINKDWQYNWSDGFIGLKREVAETGTYILIVSNQGSCHDSAAVYIEFIDNPEFRILYDNSLELCFGDSVVLKSSIASADFDYIWSDGSKNSQITVRESGTYVLTATNSTGCKFTDEVTVFVAPLIELEINADKSYLCYGDSVTLVSNSRYASYIWSTGDTNDFIRVHESGIYKLIVRNQYGCADTSEIEIKEINFDASFSKNEFRIDSICSGESITDFLEIIYKSEDSVEIADLEYRGDNFVFDLNQNIISGNPGTYKHNIELTAGINRPGIYKGEIIVTVEKPCYHQIILPVYVKVYSGFEMSAPEIFAEAGDEICIKVTIISNCENNKSFLFSPTFSIDILSQYFYPDSVWGGKLIENITKGSNRILTIKMDEQNFPKGMEKYVKICGKVLLGQQESSPIKLSDADWDSDYLYTNFKNGSLHIEGCSQDLRTIKMFKPITMTISPNPISEIGNIIINSQEVGRHFVDIYSVDGRIVKTYELTNFEKENMQIITIDAVNFEQGLYQVILRSPWNLLKGKIMIIKN